MKKSAFDELESVTGQNPSPYCQMPYWRMALNRAIHCTPKSLPHEMGISGNLQATPSMLCSCDSETTRDGDHYTRSAHTSASQTVSISRVLCLLDGIERIFAQTWK